MTLNDDVKAYAEKQTDYQYALGNDAFINTTSLEKDKTYLFLIPIRNTYNFENTREEIDVDVVLARAGDIGDTYQTKYQENIADLEVEARKLRQYFLQCRHHRLEEFYWEPEVNQYAENLDGVRVRAGFIAYNRISPS